MKRVLTIVITLILISSTTLAYGQTGIPGSGWWSGEQVQNVGDTTETITVTAYDAASSNTFTASHSIASGGAFTFVPNDFAGMPAGFQGSAVVSSAGPIKAIVNVTNRLSGDLGIAGGKAAAQYQGVDSSMVATTLYFPLVKGDYYSKTTTFYIQNAGTSPTTATATFTMKNGNIHTYTTPSIGVYQMVAFSIYDTPTYNPAGQPAGWDGRIGSLVVQSNSSQPLAGTVMEHFTTEAIATVLQSTRAFTNADFDTKAYAPVIKHTWFQRFTGIQVQNVSGGSVNVTVTYKGSQGACAGNTYVDTHNGVPLGGSWTFVQWEGQTNLAANCIASATIEATGNILAVVNESYRSDMIPATGQRAVTTSTIPNNTTTGKLSAPLFKDDHYGKRTGLQIQNVGTVTATDIVATFSCTHAPDNTTFTATSLPQTVAAGAAVLFYTPSTQNDKFPSPNPFLSNSVICSVIVTSAQPIVAIANESVIPGGTVQQDNNAYEAFNLAP